MFWTKWIILWEHILWILLVTGGEEVEHSGHPQHHPEQKGYFILLVDQTQFLTLDFNKREQDQNKAGEDQELGLVPFTERELHHTRSRKWRRRTWPAPSLKKNNEINGKHNPHYTWCEDCGVVEPLVPREVEPNFQAAVVPPPLLLLVAVQRLVVDHVGVVVPDGDIWHKIWGTFKFYRLFWFSTHLSTLLLSMMPAHCEPSYLGSHSSGTLLRPDQMNSILSAVWNTLSMLKSHMGESKGKMWRSPSQFNTRCRLWSKSWST